MKRPFSLTRELRLLRNVIYTGRIRPDQKMHAGEHEAIVEIAVWDEVNACLSGTRQVRQRFGSKALLAGLLYCDSCGSVMRPTSTAHNGRRYRYYGSRQACATKPLPANGIERSVMEQIVSLGSAPKEEAMTRLLCAQQPRGKARASERQLARALTRLPQVWAAEPGAAGRSRSTADRTHRL